MLGHKYIKPKSIHNNDIVCEFSDAYMYLACIKFINTASLFHYNGNFRSKQSLCAGILQC